jgi:predicted transposase/invertase (TIGR01784 family)
MGGTTDIFELAEIARLEPQDRMVYEDSLKDYRDLKAALETSFKEGVAEGIEKNKLEVAKAALKEGLDVGTIAKLTGLPKEDIEALRSR